MSNTMQSRDAIRIALVADPHITRGTAGEQPLYPGRLEKAVAAVNAAHVDLVLLAGDLTENGAPEEIADFKALIEPLRAPTLLVAGNHDVGGKLVPGAEDGVTTVRVEQWERLMGPSFFVEACGRLRVIGINASLLGSGLPRESDQWRFLETELQEPQPSTTIMLTHYPLFLETADEPGDPYWNIEPGPRARLVALFQRAGVQAVLSGHLHRPMSHQLGSVLCLAAPPVSFGLPRGQQPQGWALLTVSAAGRVRAEVRHLVE